MSNEYKDWLREEEIENKHIPEVEEIAKEEEKKRKLHTVAWASGRKAKLKYHTKKCRSCKKCMNGGVSIIRWPIHGKGTYRYEDVGPIGFQSEELQLKRLKKFMKGRES